MVVVCESCSTRFRIDDARIPAKGRLVRCSHCKATFIAKPQDASFEETVEEVVAEITDAGGPPVPEPAADLFAAGGAELGETATRTATTGEEERWEFDEEPRKASAEPDGRERFGKPGDTEPPVSPLDDIGDPTEWDLLRGSVEPEAREAEFIEPVAAPPVRKVEAAAEPPRRALSAEPAPLEAPLAIRRRSPASVLGELAGSVLGASAWLALGLLGLLGASPLLPLLPPLPGEAPREVARPAPRTIGLADGEAREVRGSFVENAFAPWLFVVQGELTRPDPDPRLGLRVHFVSALGARTGGAAWAGVSRTARDLRERTPALLRSESDASAAAAARGGRFVAVFPRVPADAAGFELSLEPLLELPPATAPSHATEAAPEATASSPPARPPSSE